MENNQSRLPSHQPRSIRLAEAFTPLATDDLPFSLQFVPTSRRTTDTISLSFKLVSQRQLSTTDSTETPTESITAARESAATARGSSVRSFGESGKSVGREITEG